MSLTFHVVGEPFITHFDFYKAIENLSIKVIDMEYSNTEILQLSTFLIELDHTEQLKTGMKPFLSDFI